MRAGDCLRDSGCRFRPGKAGEEIEPERRTAHRSDVPEDHPEGGAAGNVMEAYAPAFAAAEYAAQHPATNARQYEPLVENVERSEGEEQKARAAGCDDYVPKPYSPRHLMAKIRQHLS